MTNKYSDNRLRHSYIYTYTCYSRRNFEECAKDYNIILYIIVAAI